MSTIARIEISHHRLPLDPPFPAAWDPQPRKWFPATVVRVYDDAGRVGIGSGDAMYGFADHAHHFLGEDPLELDRHAAVLANVDFHAGRPWPLGVEWVEADDAFNFALYSRHATGVTLLGYAEKDLARPAFDVFTVTVVGAVVLPVQSQYP